MIGIYKITNNINGKSYIGQSVNIEKRWKKHRLTMNNNKDHCYDYPLYRAFRKYGIHNFDFTILEECEHCKLDERERYWIDVYGTLKNGYNQTFGGDGSFSRLNSEKLNSITAELRNTNRKMKDIANDYDISVEMVQGINTGRYWNRQIEYPIRKKAQPKKYYCARCGKEISKGSKVCFDCHLESIREKRPSRDELENLIYDNSFEEIGRIYGVTGKAISKWCYTYGLPSKRREIQKILTERKIA